MLDHMHDLMESEKSIAAARLVPESAFKQTVRSAIEKTRLHEQAFGDYLEFGVYNGTSLYCMYQLLEDFGLTEARLFGFDSFQGLPLSALVQDNRIWLPGQYKCGLELTRRVLTERGIDWEKVRLIKGWFRDTLTDELMERHHMQKASIIMIDCDLYSSSREALTFCAPLIKDHALIIFDDWHSGDLDRTNQGEKRAFTEFLQENPDLRAVEIGSYNETSLLFHVRRRGEGSAAA